MKSLTGKFASGRGWALLLILFLGAGLVVAACGDEDVPAPTTPAPPPPAPTPAPEPEPEPEPEAPAVPVGLMVSATTESSITWTWNAVEGATGYVVQSSTDEMFDDMVLGNPETVLFNGVPFTSMTSYTATDLDAETSLYVRVAAAAGTAAAPLVSAFSTHVTGMATAAASAAPAAPMNVRSTAQGSNYIEWSWDAVSGAAGYHAQFSRSTDFSDPASDRPVLQRTSVRISNLPAETDGYLRVRAYTGSGTGEDTEFSDWSATSQSSTTEPPPPPPPTTTQLPTPSGVTASGATRNTITVRWSAVAEADSYTVEQSRSGGGYGASSCDGGGSEVDGTSCVAGDLDPGISYTFRVRSNSDASDVTSSGWGTSGSVTTQGRATTPAPTGGDDAPDIEWETDESMIRWSWAPAPGVEYQVALLKWDTTMPASTRRCPSLSGPPVAASPLSVDAAGGGWFGEEPLFAKDLPIVEDNKGSVYGLCVVGTWETETGRQYGDVSLAWATVPAGGTIPTADGRITAGPTEDASGRVTKSINWFLDLDDGFSYSVRTASKVHGSTGDLSCETSDPSGSTTRKLGDSNRFELPISASGGYTDYIACVKASNDDGESRWEQVGAQYATLPGKVSGISYNTASSTVAADSITSVWTFSGSGKLPVDPGDYSAKVFVWVGTATDASLTDPNNSGAKPPTEAQCESGTATGFSSTVIDGSDFEELGGNKFSFMAAISSLGSEESYRLYACVQAEIDRAALGGNADDPGAWAVGSTTVKTLE